MGFIGSMLGAGKGSDFVAQGSAPAITSPVNQGQIDTAYNQTQTALKSQEDLLNALAPQGTQGMASQLQLGNQLNDQAQGRGPNPAQAQLAQNTSQNVANQASLMAGQRGAGANPAMFARLAAQQGSNIQQNSVGQAATLGAQQQLAAQQQLQQLAATQLGQQQGAVTGYNQAAQSEQQNLLNAQSATNMASAGVAANINNTNSATQIQNSKAQQGIFGGLLGGAGGILSDENVKTNVKPADDKIQSFLDNVSAHEYSYKDSVKGHPGAAPGRHVGPMAQELEQSELGRQMVTQGPDGKGVDFQRGLGTIVASLAALNERLDAMEGKKKPQHMAQGGEVRNYAVGGNIAPMAPLAPAAQVNAPPQGPQSSIGKFMYGFTEATKPQQGQDGGMQNLGGDSGGNPVGEGMKKLTQKVGEKYVKPLFESAPANVNMGQGPTVSNLMKEPGYAQYELGADASAAPMAGTPEAVEHAGTASAAEAGGEGFTAAGGSAAATEGTEAATAYEGAEGAAALGESESALSGSEALLALNKGGNVGHKLKKGGSVPGKAKYKGDTTKNDTVSAKLSPGEVVIPKSVMESPDPVSNAAKFVAAVMARKKVGR